MNSFQVPISTVQGLATHAVITEAPAMALDGLVKNAVQNDPSVLAREAGNLGVSLPDGVSTFAQMEKHLSSLGEQQNVAALLLNHAKTAVTETASSAWLGLYRYRFAPLGAAGLACIRALQWLTQDCSMMESENSEYACSPDPDPAHWPTMSDFSVGLAYTLAGLLPTQRAFRYLVSKLMHDAPDFQQWWDSNKDRKFDGKNERVPATFQFGDIANFLAKMAAVGVTQHALDNGMEPLTLCALWLGLGVLAKKEVLTTPLEKNVNTYCADVKKQKQIRSLSELAKRIRSLDVQNLPVDNANLQKQILVTFIKERLDYDTNLCAAALSTAEKKRREAEEHSSALDPTKLSEDDLRRFRACYNEEIAHQDRLIASYRGKLQELMEMRIKAFTALLELTSTMPSAEIDITNIDDAVAYKLKVTADISRRELDRKVDGERHEAITRILNETQGLIQKLVSEAELVQSALRELGVETTTTNLMSNGS